MNWAPDFGEGNEMDEMVLLSEGCFYKSLTSEQNDLMLIHQKINPVKATMSHTYSTYTNRPNETYSWPSL